MDTQNGLNLKEMESNTYSLHYSPELNAKCQPLGFIGIQTD